MEHLSLQMLNATCQKERKKESTVRRMGLMSSFDIEFFRKNVKVRATDLEVGYLELDHL